MTASQDATFVDTAGNKLQLTLFMFAGCPFCRLVTDTARALGLALPMRDIRKDPDALATLLRVGGKKTVPCLFINGEPMYESAAIAGYLRRGIRTAAGS
jgi:glutaredoxin